MSTAIVYGPEKNKMKSSGTNVLHLGRTNSLLKRWIRNNYLSVFVEKNGEITAQHRPNISNKKKKKGNGSVACDS